jgi:hypothetical protein
MKIYRLIKDNNNVPVFSEQEIALEEYPKYLKEEEEKAKKEREEAQKQHQKIENPEIRKCEFCGEDMEVKVPWQKYHPECAKLKRNKLLRGVYKSRKEGLKKTKEEQYEKKIKEGSVNCTYRKLV